MWESPIQMITDDIIKDLVQKQDELLIESVRRVGFNIDKDELLKALNYDRDQYEKGYDDGRSARDSEIVRCKDCKHRNKYECNHIMLGGTKCGVTEDWYCADGERKETDDAEIH